MRERREGETSGVRSEPGTSTAPGRSTLTEDVTPRDPAGAVAQAASSPGEALPAAQQRSLGTGFAADLSSVRVHSGLDSQEAASAVGARAYTVGQDIHFGAGEYAPGSADGDRLLAHEVAHTVQQADAQPTLQAKLEVSEPGDAAEAEADQAAEQVLSGQPAPVLGAAPAKIMRKPGPKVAPKGAGAAPPPPTGGPSAMDELDQAMATHDGAGALKAYHALSKPDRAHLKTDPLLLERLLSVLSNPNALVVLKEVAPPRAVWLDLANRGFAGDVPALIQSLHDVGIKGGDIPANFELFADGSNFRNPAVLWSLLNGLPGAAALMLFQDERTVELLRAIFPTESPLKLLPALKSAPGAEIVGVYQRGPLAGFWLSSFPADFSAILLASPAAAPAAVRQLYADMDLLLLVVHANRSGWGLVLSDMLATPEAEDRTALAPGAPGSAALLAVVAGYQPADAAEIMLLLLYTPMEALDAASQGGWLSSSTVELIVASEGMTAALQMVIATSPQVSLLTGLGHPDQILSLLTADVTMTLDCYRSGPLFAAWVRSDPGKWRDLIISQHGTSEWATELTKSDIPSLLRLAGLDRTYASMWKQAVDSQNLYDAIVDGSDTPLMDHQQADGLWNLYGRGASGGRGGAASGNRSNVQSLKTFQHLFNQHIAEPGETVTVLKSEERSWGYWKHTWRWFYQALRPDDAAARDLMAMVSTLPRAQVSAASQIVFAQQRQLKHKKEGLIAGGHDYEDDGAPDVLGTSWYMGDDNLIVIRATGTNAKGEAIIDSGGDTPESDGNAKYAGANLGLSYFQNHARHEIGHAVGARNFAGVPMKGNDWVVQYSGWKHSSRSALRSALWAGSGSYEWTLNGTTQTVDEEDCADWLIHLLENGEQKENAIGKLQGSVAEKLDLIKASRWGSQPLVGYVHAVWTQGSVKKASDMPGLGYQFPAFSAAMPGPTVHMFCSRSGGYTEYSRDVLTSVLPTCGWYALSASGEMFAELYTRRYTDGATPVAINGLDPKEYFNQLEQSNDTWLTGFDSKSGAPPTAGAAKPPGPEGQTGEPPRPNLNPGGTPFEG